MTELLPLSKIAIPGDDAIYGVRKIVRAMPLGRKNVEVMTELLVPLSKIAIPGDDAIYGVRKIVRAIPLGRKNVEVERVTELLLPLSKIAIPISPEITRGRRRQYTEQGKLPAGCHVKCLRPRGSGFSVSAATLLASWFRAHGSGLTVLTSRF